MSIEFFIARRIGTNLSGTTRMRVMVFIAALSVALSVSMMIISLGVVRGFKEHVGGQVAGFVGDMRLWARDTATPYLTMSFVPQDDLRTSLSAVSGVRSVSGFIEISSMMISQNQVQGVEVLGVGEDYSWDFIRDMLLEGELPHYTDSTVSRRAVISQQIARTMELEVGDVFELVFFTDEPSRDKFKVEAIYSSSMSDFDDVFIICDVAALARILDYPPGMIMGYDIRVSSPDVVFDIEDAVSHARYRTQTTPERFPQIYDWLGMLDANTLLILVIMFAVASISMISSVLLVILENMQLIGTLLSQGIRRWQLHRIFLYRCGMIVFRGLFFGNLLGLGLCAVQGMFSVVKLDSSAYLVSAVPVSLNVAEILALNVGVFAAIMLLMMFPVMILSRITPDRSIKFK